MNLDVLSVLVSRANQHTILSNVALCLVEREEAFFSVSWLQSDWGDAMP